MMIVQRVDDSVGLPGCLSRLEGRSGGGGERKGRLIARNVLTGVRKPNPTLYVTNALECALPWTVRGQSFFDTIISDLVNVSGWITEYAPKAASALIETMSFFCLQAYRRTRIVHMH